MSFLYIDEQGCIIGFDNNAFYVKHKDEVVKRIPSETLEAITVFGNIQMTSQCTRECLLRGIPVNYFSKSGAYFGRLSSTRHTNVRRFKEQVYRSEDEAFCLALSKKIINAKINNQIVLLKRYGSKQNVDECVLRMKNSKLKIQECTSIQQVMGYEGHAAREYFNGLSMNIINEFKFNGRSKRPPKDKFNSVISLGYTILMYEIYNELENHGLNPYVGFTHSDREKHPTLASDIMEDWRTIVVDSTAMNMINRFELKEEHFVSGEYDDGVYLTKDGLKLFINKLEQKLKNDVNYLSYVDYPTSFRRAISLQVGQLVKAIEENDPDIYEPIKIR